MTELQGLVVDVEARITKLERGLAKANQTQRKAAAQMERTARENARRIGAAYDGVGPRMQRAMMGLARIGGGLLAGSAVSRGIGAYTRLADEATQMQNALRNAGLEGANLSRVYEQLFKSAQRNSAPVGSLVDLYSKLALTQSELGVSSDDLIRFTDGIAVALKVAGTDATAASGALLQLSQALGGGIVRAEEFNSILEGTPTIAQAVARGLKEAGGSVAELRKLVVDGEVSSAAFFRAFQVGSAELRAQAANSQLTVGQAMTRIGNSLVTAAGEFDQASGASASLARILGELANGISSFDATGFVGKIQSIADAARDAETAVSGWLRAMANAESFADLNEVLGITEGGQIVNPDVREAEKKIAGLEREVENLQAQIENNTEMGFDNTEALARLREVRAELAAIRAEAASLPRHVAGLRPDGSPVYNMQNTGTGITGYEAPPTPVPVEPVSITTYPAGGAGRSGGGGGGGGGGGRSARIDEYQREVKAIQERTQALQIETAQLVLAAAGERDLAEAQDYARVKSELLHAAQKSGQKITSALMAKIDKMAESYTRAAKSAREAVRQIKAVESNARAGANATADLFVAATDSADAFKGALLDLARTMMRNQILKLVSGLPGMQQFGALLTPPDGFASGGYTGAGGKFEPAGIVHRGEFVISREAVQRLGAENLDRLHQSALRGYADGGLVGAAGKVQRAASDSLRAATAIQNISIAPVINVNANGGSSEQNADLARQVSAETEKAMRGLVRDELIRQHRSGNMLAGRR